MTTSVVCVAFLAQILAGCAEMTDQQKGAATGAGAGAILGGIIGALADPKNPGRGAAIDAAAGLLVGGATGWAIGEYRSRQVKVREQVVTEKQYTPAQGVLFNIDRATATPQQLKPGDELTFQVHYTVLLPTQTSEMRVRETRTLFFGEQVLRELPPREVGLPQGTTEFTFPLNIPKDAAQGNYTVLTTVEPVASAGPTKQEARSPFIVSTAAFSPPAQPAAVAAQPVPQAVSEVLYVKSAVANVREGPSTAFKVVATAKKGARLDVLDRLGGTDNRWYRIRLESGQEGWIAASVVTSSP